MSIIILETNAVVNDKEIEFNLKITSNKNILTVEILNILDFNKNEQTIKNISDLKAFISKYKITIPREFYDKISSNDNFVIFYQRDFQELSTYWKYQDIEPLNKNLYDKFSYTIIKELRDNHISISDYKSEFSLTFGKKSTHIPVDNEELSVLVKNIINAYIDSNLALQDSYKKDINHKGFIDIMNKVKMDNGSIRYTQSKENIYKFFFIL